MIDPYIEALNDSHRKITKDFIAETNPNGTDFFNRYLNISAPIDRKSGNAQTHIMIETDNDGRQTIVGFYSLRASSLVKDTDDYNGARIGEPALEIYQLAVRKDRQKQGIGTSLMMDIIAKVTEAAKVIGIKHLLVCSVKESVGFYEKCQFKIIPHYKRYIPRNDSNIDCIGMSLPLQIDE